MRLLRQANPRLDVRAKRKGKADRSRRLVVSRPGSLAIFVDRPPCAVAFTLADPYVDSGRPRPRSTYHAAARSAEMSSRACRKSGLGAMHIVR
jgi:hypothetical protein